MSSRVTRSSARLAASAPGESHHDDHETTAPFKSTPKTRKRKATTLQSSSPTTSEVEKPISQSSTRRSKRQKTSNPPSSGYNTTPISAKSSKRLNNQEPDMSSNGSAQPHVGCEPALTKVSSSSKQNEDVPSKSTSKTSSRRSSGRGTKKPSQGSSDPATVNTDTHDTPDSSSPPVDTRGQRKLKKKPPKPKDSDKKDVSLATKPPTGPVPTSPPPPGQSDSNGDLSPESSRDGDGDPFSAALFGRGAPAGLSSTLRALSGMMSGMATRFRDILANLKRMDDPTMQMIALEELSNLLLVSNEDNLSGQFSPDPYVKELVALMLPNPLTGEENPEIMLLACRSLANLMEALRGSVANVVYGGAVPVLCQKLLDIQYIDVAEQALSTLSKVSIDFPASIVREGGLTACLQYLDFFATGTQRTAVTTAANCCRNIPHDSFPVIRDVMPILQNVLASHDQRVVEQGCLCVTRIIDSFKHSSDKTEQLVDPPLLKAILRLLLPGTTNLIGPNIHTEFLRVLAIVARNSPRLSTELLKMNVVDTLYQILTGVSPPADTSDAAANIDSVVIMQALVHRPREQIYEALNVICELLPRVTLKEDSDMDLGDLFEYSSSDNSTTDNTKPTKLEQRRDLLKTCQAETRRFAMILLPTLTDAYSSTVNLSVRQKVLTAQLKILSNLDTKVIEEALRPVPYASFLASILSQEDHPSLVMFALQASELLFERLENIYQYQFHREGVIGEIKKLASRTLQIDSEMLAKVDSHLSKELTMSDVGQNQEKPKGSGETTDDDDDGDDDEGNDDDDDEDEEDREDAVERAEEIILHGGVDDDDDDRSSASGEEIPSPIAIPGIDDLVIMRAKTFISTYDTQNARNLRSKAEKIRDDLRILADSISKHYHGADTEEDGCALFERLAAYFHGDALESITSSELLESGIIRLLGDILTMNAEVKGNPRGDFMAAFMSATNMIASKGTVANPAPTAFSILVHKLEDLLSRAEHFEVLTVNSSAAENSRSSSTSLLSRQIRLKLTADDDSDIPQSYRDIIVSIHAIATFKALDDYLRPRMALSERPASGRRRDMLQQLANARMAQFSGVADSGLFAPFGTDLGMIPPPPGPVPHPSLRPGLRSNPEPPAPENDAEKGDTTRSTRRRSSRRQAESAPEPTPAVESTPARNPGRDESPMKLEIVDEKNLEEPAASQDTDSSQRVEAIVGEVEEEVSADEAEPDAVNMEVASTGRLMARREDGSRVYTPRQPGTPVPAAGRASADPTPTSTPGNAATGQKRPTSYAAAAATPTDWHIEFSINGKPISSNITIYRAIHHNRDAPVDPSNRGIWAGIHEIKYRKVKGVQPMPTLSTAENRQNEIGEDGLPVSLDGHPITSSILILLRILHELNAGLDDVREALGRAGVQLHAEPLASFINTKLTAKMNRQLEEPLIVASNCLPDWSEDLAQAFPFLFPFETRHLFLQSTSFGYSRSITRWQNSQTETDDRRDRRRDDRPLMGRPMRQKVRIARGKMLESAMKVMDHFGASPSILEVEYFDEVGTGLGPTLEFYSTVSKEFAKKQMKLWRENETDANDQYAFGKNGLFPAPISVTEQNTETGKKILHAFKMLGMFVARSMLDSRIIDINFNATFFKFGDGYSGAPTISLLRTVDTDLANSIAQLQQYANRKHSIQSDQSLSDEAKSISIGELRIQNATLEDLSLDFTLPGYPSIELIENGSDIEVTNDNVESYIERVLDYTLGSGVRPQIDAFQHGFSQVFPYSSLKAFTPNELVMLFGKVEEDWTIETLTDSVKADHGFNMDSKSVKNLLQVMSELSSAQRRDFLQFVTGSPRLPIGGFKNLTPMFTVVCKPSEPPYTSDDYLPSVMTCANYLKLPDYSDMQVLKARLGIAIKEGQGAFHLS